MSTEHVKEVGVAAIANARGGRRGVPPIANIVEVLPARILAEVSEDMDAVMTALAAAGYVILARCEVDNPEASRI